MTLVLVATMSIVRHWIGANWRSAAPHYSQSSPLNVLSSLVNNIQSDSTTGAPPAAGKGAEPLPHYYSPLNARVYPNYARPCQVMICWETTKMIRKRCPSLETRDTKSIPC